MKKLIIGIVISGLSISAWLLGGQTDLRLRIEASPDTIFKSGNIQARILNTSAFQKPGAARERVILLVNERLYGALTKEIRQLIQDMFDEGIDVWPFLVDHAQFLASPISWRTDAGAWLKNFVHDAYFQAGLDKIPGRENRGLVILGAFPATFINWHQETKWPRDKDFPPPPQWTEPKVTNDFVNGAIDLNWAPYRDQNPIRYDIRVYEVPKPADNPADRVPLPNDFTTVPGNQTDWTYYPSLQGQRNFQFEVVPIFNNAAPPPSAFSNIVNWNFLVNPSDYVLADIDGFQTVVSRIFEYQQEGGQNYKIDANPHLVVTHRIDSNAAGHEISPTDKKAGRKYAETEMTYGRIDAFSLTGGWATPGLDAAFINDRRMVSPARYFEEEVALIRGYLLRNHGWRKNKIVRDAYDRIYIFRSSDFIGKIDEKTQIKSLWDHQPGIRQVLLDDAKKASGGPNDKYPTATLYADKKFLGASLPLKDKDGEADLDQTAFPNRTASSLKIDLQGGGGLVFLFSKPRSDGNRQSFNSDIDDLGTTKVGDDAVSSVELWNAFEASSPSWDSKSHLFRHLQANWRLVDLGAHGNPDGFLLSRGMAGPDLDRPWEERAVSAVDKTKNGPEDIWRLGGDIKFLINHSCFNGQFMAPGNAATTFLFRNKVLAEWAWSGAGTIEHEVLHDRLRTGDRFGAAAMKNMDAQMSAAGSNPWRTYFSVVLGDPTLRLFYRLPDLVVKEVKPLLEVSKLGAPPVFRAVIGNHGDRGLDQNQFIDGRWEIYPASGDRLLQNGVFSSPPLKAGEERVAEFSSGRPFARGEYKIRLILDDKNKIPESDENNNTRETTFIVVGEPKEPPRRKTRFQIKLGGLSEILDEPPFIFGQPNTEGTRLEFSDAQDFVTGSTFSLSGEASIEVFLTSFISLDIGAAYTERTTRVENTNRPGYADETSLKTASVPVLLKLNVGGGNVRFFLGGGIESMYLLSMKNRFQWQSGGTSHEEYFGDDETKFGKRLVDLLGSRFSPAALVSVGIRVGALILEGRYFSGLSDLSLDFSQTYVGGKVNAGKIRGLSLLAGFSF